MNGCRDKTVVIAGAGVAGLTLGLLLARQGIRPVLVERDREVGGLARSFTYDDFTFDIGPHRFHTDNPLVDRFVRDALADDLIEIQRKSAVWMAGRYLDWPLDVSAAFKLPFRLLIASALELFKKRECRDDSFESYIISRYGRPLYEVFFRPYTEKFLGLPCAMISKDWAVTGIDRAVIDSSIRVDDMLSLVRAALNPAPPLGFLYPRSGGIGVFARRVAAMIEDAGGRILPGESISGVELEGGKICRAILQGGEVLGCDRLFWTAPITALQRIMGEPAGKLDYLSMLIYNFRVREPARIPYQWCYFGSADVPFNRVSIPSNFNPALSPPGACGVCVEVTCPPGDPRLSNPEQGEPAIRKALADTGLIGRQAAIEGLAIEHIREVYPMYGLDYRLERDRAIQGLSRIPNLHLLGRSGRFWYNNMDNSIEDAMATALRMGGADLQESLPEGAAS